MAAPPAPPKALPPMRPPSPSPLSPVARLTLSLLAAPLAAVAQQPALQSHEINPDRSVTFRLYAPAAASVTVAR